MLKYIKIKYYAHREEMGRKAAGRSAGGGAACFTPRHVPRSCEPACTKRHRHRGEGEEVLHSAALRPARSLPYEGYGPGGGARGAGRAQSREGDDIRRLRCGRHYGRIARIQVSEPDRTQESVVLHSRPICRRLRHIDPQHRPRRAQGRKAGHSAGLRH